MPGLPSLTELGLLGQSPKATEYTPWWTTFSGPDESVYAFTFGSTDQDRPAKRRAVSTETRTLPRMQTCRTPPSQDDVPELELEAEAESDASDASSDASSDGEDAQSPESSPEPAPRTLPVPNTALALPLRHVLPLPVPPKADGTETKKTEKTEKTDRTEKRKREAPRGCSVASLLAPAPVVARYKFDRVDQLGGRPRGARRL